MPDERFWQNLDQLVASSRLVIDRPKGSRHPRCPDAVYPLDYGYLEGTAAGDGAGIDAWLGSDPGRRVTAVVVTIDTLKRDAEVKVLLGCTPAEAREILRFHDEGHSGAILVERLG